jgi:hypothetical protein
MLHPLCYGPFMLNYLEEFVIKGCKKPSLHYASCFSKCFVAIIAFRFNQAKWVES